MKMPHWPQLLGEKPIHLGLERIEKLLEIIGNPHLTLNNVIHVAGTNGKGSTIAFIGSILKAAGYTVNIYTSPHLVDFNERININGSQISDSYLKELAEECRIKSEMHNIKPTFFEGTTALAFLAFARNNADFTLIETGLGGRLDATNVVNPILTIITPISLDHTEYLGNSLKLIAGEKAGIIKQNIPCVIAQQLDIVFEVLESKANQLNSPVIAYEYDFGMRFLEGRIQFLSKEINMYLPLPNLPGDHQFINAATAISAILSLNQEYKIDDHHIAMGIKSVKWPARLQKLNKGNLVELLPNSDWEIWLDGAHNESGAQILSVWAEQHHDKPIYLINGMTKGRDCSKFLSYFRGKIEEVHGLFIDNEPSSYSACHIVEAAKTIGIKAVEGESLEDAIFHITKSSNRPAIILICGSLYLAGYALKANDMGIYCGN